MAEGPLSPLISFGRDLRARGLPVGTGRILTFCRGVVALGLTDRDSLYWAGRVSLVANRADLETYDEAFDDWYRGLGAPDAGLDLRLRLPVAEPDLDLAELPDGLEVTVGAAATSWRGADDDEEPAPDEESSIRIVASAVEVLRGKSFADLSEEERARVARMIRELTIRVPVERTRRTRAAPKGPTFDLRRTLRRSLRTQGEPFDRAWRTRRSRRRPLVLDPRYQRLDGALLAGAPPVRLRRHGGGPARRGLLLRHAPDPGDAHAPDEGPRSGDARDLATRRGLGRRDPDRRIAEGVARRLEPARRAPRRRGGALLGRPRTRRSRPAAIADGTAAAARPQGGLGEPPQGLAPLRAARPRDRRPACRASTSSSRATTWRASSTSGAC